MSKRVEQFNNQPVDIKDWQRDKEFEQYPEGAREKTLVYCPNPAPYKFLKAEERYLFKKSSHRYLEQYWVEIIAYRIGVFMEVPVPPTFVAYDSNLNQSAALIEWFYPIKDLYISGGNYFKSLIPEFDEKTGKQHNFETIQQIFQKLESMSHLDWQLSWAKIFVFDALLGNTDRHQDNWGIIFRQHIMKDISISPAFDNGTSMGHEHFASKFKNFEAVEYLRRYVLKGKHHMKWSLSDKNRIGHAEMLDKIACLYPQTRQIMLDCLKKVNEQIFSKILEDLIKFDVSVKLSTERAGFMLKLLNFRHQRLLSELDK